MRNPILGRQADRRAYLLLGAISLMAVAPLLFLGPSCGHDFDFHLVSWMEALRSWRSGILYPHWTSSANYGAGEARFVFYPPLAWMLGGALGSILPWNLVPQGFTFLVLLASGITVFLLAREWLSTEQSTLAACCYIASPYTLFNAYTRTAYGELMAGVWIPLILLCALRRKLSPAWLALALAGIWLTNVPGAVMAEYLLASVAILAAWTERSYWPLLRAAWGQLLGAGLAGFFLWPAVYEKRWIAMTEAIGPGMRVEDSWLFAHTGEAFHDQVLHMASWIAVCLLALGAAGATAAWKNLEKETRRWVLPMILLIPVIFLLLLPVSNFLWQNLPELKYLQFPWRWLLVASMATALLLATAAQRLAAWEFRKTVVLVLLVTIAGATFAAYKLYQSCDEEDAVSAQTHLFQTESGVEGTDEYALLGSDNTAIQQGLPEARVFRQPLDGAAPEGEPNPRWSGRKPTDIYAAVTVQSWAPEQKHLVIESEEDGYAVLKLRDYPAWQIRVNGKTISTRCHRPDGLLTIPVNSGWSRITIEWKPTPDVFLGRTFTGIALLGLLGTAVWSRKHPSQVS